MKRFVLLSVFDKKGIVELAETFQKLGIEIITTGGTSEVLKKHKIPFVAIEKITQNPESFDGRMKTISFEIEAGILFDRKNKKHQKEAAQLKVPVIDFVVCNFYPFWEKPGIEMIDVGGPTMVRAAAKNFDHVTVIVDPSDYKEVIDVLTAKGEVDQEIRKKLAAKAFSYVASYDVQIAQYFTKQTDEVSDRFIAMTKGKKLRYGENPHQKGYFYQEVGNQDLLSLYTFKVLQGKAPSFNNLLDANGGLETIGQIGKTNPACVILKHTNPSGAATAKTIEEAFEKAWYDGDPLASFGGVIVINRPVTAALSKRMLADKKFFEVLMAPSYEKEALLLLSQKPRLQLWENKALQRPFLTAYQDVKKIRGGFLLQDGDIFEITEKHFNVVTVKKPTKEQIEDLLFAWKIAQVSKSNAVAVVKDQVLLGSGVGQQDRKRACELCVSKAGKSLKGAVAATDGFFPFRDGPDILIKAGITAIAQPGGSIRDQEVIDACDEQGVAMVFTGVRNFKH